jgi:AmpE protein
MEFLSLLIVLALLQLWGSGGPFQQDRWFTRFCGKIQTYTLQPAMRLTLIVGLPALLLLVIQALIQPVLFGLLSLMLFVSVLLYSLGRGDFSETISQYLMHWHNGNFESAYKKACDMDGADHSESVNDYVALHESVRSTILYGGYERWFAVVFWFLIFGPVGALAYRLSYLCGHGEFVEEDDRQIALRFVHYLDWLPVRLLGFSFALTGNFVNSFNQFWQIVTDNKPASELLNECGLAAISGFNEKVVYPTDQEHFIEYGKKEIYALQSLLSRSVVAWLIAIAALQFFS